MVSQTYILDHVVMIIILRLLHATVQLDSLLPITFGVIHIVGTEGFGVQVQTSEVSMIHLTIHVQGEANLGEIVGSNNATACELPAILAIIKVDTATQVPCATTGEIDRQGAVYNASLIHLLSKGLAPATCRKAVACIAIAAEILIQSDVAIVTTSKTSSLRGAQEFRCQFTIDVIGHRQIFNGNVQEVIEWTEMILHHGSWNRLTGCTG